MDTRIGTIERYADAVDGEPVSDAYVESCFIMQIHSNSEVEVREDGGHGRGGMRIDAQIVVSTEQEVMTSLMMWAYQQAKGAMKDTRLWYTPDAPGQATDWIPDVNLDAYVINKDEQIIKWAIIPFNKVTGEPMNSVRLKAINPHWVASVWHSRPVA